MRPSDLFIQPKRPWNAGRVIGPKAPLKPKRGRLDAHDFPDGGGSGGAEAFSRRRLAKKQRG